MGFVGEGQISYAGPGAVTRARLAGQIVTERLKLTGVETRETRLDLIGVDSVHGARLSGDHPDPYEVRLRVVARTPTEWDADRVAREVETLLTNGPAGGGGATRQVTETVAIESTFLPRSEVATTVTAEGL